MSLPIDVSSLGNLLGTINQTTVGDIASQAVMGLLVTGATGAFQNSGLDVLHIFHKDGSQTVVTPSGAPKPTITAAAFASLPPATQASLAAQGVIISG